MRKLLFTLLIVLPVTFSACALLDMLLGKRAFENPGVRVESVKVSGVSFDALDLLFNLAVENPNPVGVTVKKYDYELELNDFSFLKGEQDSGLRLASESTGSVDIPLTLQFADIYSALGSMEGQDSTRYRFKTNFTIDVPVMGSVQIPVQTSGHVPVICLPEIGFESLSLKRLSLTGAEAVIVIRLKNPNAFSLVANDFRYSFAIEERTVLSGIAEEGFRVDRKAESSIEFPLSLSFADLGLSLYRILSGEQGAEYRFNGSASFDTSLDFLKNVPLSFENSGPLRIVKK
jgi:LEA14-like dessication related protein